MSHLSGSVDVVRERERQARLQLLDVFRDPSPQPIFSQPVKVEVEDDTSRRIKDTLGDFTQVQHVLINDPKHLIGISASGSVPNAAAAAAGRSAERGSSSSWSASRSSVGHQSRGAATKSSSAASTTSSSTSGSGGSKRPVPVNGLHKPPANPLDSGSSRRLHHHQSSKPGGDHHKKPATVHKQRSELPKINPISSSYGVSLVEHDKYQEKSANNSSSRDVGGSAGAREKDHRRTKSRPATSTANNVGAAAISTSAPLPSSGSSSVNGAGKYSPSALQNGTVPNGLVHQRLSDPVSRKSQAKHILPPKLSIPTHGDDVEESAAPGEIEVETILKVMKQAVPPPITAIQTPKTYERGFPFPSDVAVNSNEDEDSRCWKHEQMSSENASLPSFTPSRASSQSTPTKKSPMRTSSFNLQEDLEMSDSDDEVNIGPSRKNSELSELTPCSKSPSNVEDSYSNKVMVPSEKGPPESSAQSSSSGSSDSESEEEESCSESNDSESSASSDASSDIEKETKPPQQKWRLSTFFDETRRNHSPASFVPVDTNSSSNAGVAISKEDQQPPSSLSSSLEKDGFSLADEDSVNRILGKYSDHHHHHHRHASNEYLSSPGDDYLNYSVPHAVKSSPVPSPVIPSPVPAPLPPHPRGPRTPPSPPEQKELPKQPSSLSSSSLDSEEKAASEHKDSPPYRQEYPSSRAEFTSKCDLTMQQRTKKKNVPKAAVSPVVDTKKKLASASSGQPPSASRETADEVKDALRPTASCPVPSAKATTPTAAAAAAATITHRSTVRSHHHGHHRSKHSSNSPLPSAKRDSSQTESSVAAAAASEGKSDLPPFKSKTFPRHAAAAAGEQEEEEASSCYSRVSSRASSAARSESAQVDAHAKVEKKMLTKGDGKKKKSSGRHAREGSSNNNKERTSSSSSSLKSGCPSTHASKSGKTSKSERHHSRPSAESRKKPDKKKKSKFSIENFWKSPRPSETEDFGRTANSSPEPDGEYEDSPDVSPVREELPRRIATADSEGKKRRKSSTSSFTSRSRSRSNSRSRTADKPKSIISSSKRPGSHSSDSRRRKHKESSNPDAVAAPPPRLAPSPPDSPDFEPDLTPSQVLPSPHISSSSKMESAISPVVVSIPLTRLLRIPGHHEIKPPKDRTEQVFSKASSNFADSPERRTSASSSPCKKDYKAKHRTNSNKTSPSKNSSEKLSKTAKVEPSVHRNSSPVVVGDRTSIEYPEKKAKASKDMDVQLLKKRKVDDPDPGAVKKKPKVSVKPFQAVESDCVDNKMPVVKLERMERVEAHSQPEKRHLERCDSTSSLSSLCSQQSHKSSKSNKERTKERDGSEMKKLSVSLPLTKEIKCEKEERPKVVVKKDPGLAVKTEKSSRSKTKDRASSLKGSSSNDVRKDCLNTSSQVSYWEDPCKMEDVKPELPSHHQRVVPMDYGSSHDTGSDYERFTPDIQQELKGMANHVNKVNLQSSNGPVPMDYYYTEGKKLKHLAEKETDPVKQALKYFEATVMFILTSHHRELSNKDPDSIYQIYKDTLRFTHVIRSCIQKHQAHSMPGSLDFKILILCLKCQSLLHLKLYNLKIKEVKEQHKGVSEFMHSSSSKMSSHLSPQPAGSSQSSSRNLFQPSPCQPRVGGPGSVPSPHSPTPSPAGSVASVGSQSSGYSSSELNGNHSRAAQSSLQLPHVPQQCTVAVPQNMFDVMARHHTHLSNLHMCHELWEQADMYMTRSNSRDFFREVAEKSEKLSLHSNIKELVSYLQTGLALLRDKDC